MDFCSLPVELSLCIFELANNSKIVLVSTHFYSLKDLYFGKNFSKDNLDHFCKTKDFRAVNPEFRKVFSFEHFMTCFDNSFDGPIKAFGVENMHSKYGKKEMYKVMVFYNRWLGRNNMQPIHDERFEYIHSVPRWKDFDDAFWFGMGEKDHKENISEENCRPWKLGNEYATIESSSNEQFFHFQSLGAYGKVEIALEIMEKVKNDKPKFFAYLVSYCSGCSGANNKKSWRDFSTALKLNKDPSFLNTEDYFQNFEFLDYKCHVISVMFESK